MLWGPIKICLNKDQIKLSFKREKDYVCFFEREQILLKQNVYDLLHNTRIGGKAFLFIIW